MSSAVSLLAVSLLSLLAVSRQGCSGWVPSLAQDSRRKAPRHLPLPLQTAGDADAGAVAATDKQFSFLATCIPGLANVLADELKSLHDDVQDVRTSGTAGVTFAATRKASLHVLLHARVAHRVLELVASTDGFGRRQQQSCVLYDRDDLYAFVYDQAHADDLLRDHDGGLLSMSVRTVLHNAAALPRDLCHSHYSAMTIKRALCDAVRDSKGRRRNGKNEEELDNVPIDLDDPDVPIYGVLRGMCGSNPDEESAASLSLYRSLHSPASLHKRGYRGSDDLDESSSPIHRAAMKESLAAGLLYHAGWHRWIHSDDMNSDENGPLPLLCVDPMAGSGTLILEAALMAADVAPGLVRIQCQVAGSRTPPVVRWNDEGDVLETWKQILFQAAQRAKTGRAKLQQRQLRFLANDPHPGAVALLEESLRRAGLRSMVWVTSKDCHDLELAAGFDDVWLFTNPPWGVRLDENVEGSWDSLRHFLRDTCPTNTNAWVLIGGGGGKDGDGDFKPSQLHKTASARLRMKRQGGNSMLALQTGAQELRWIQYKVTTDVDTHDRNDQGDRFRASSSSSSFVADRPHSPTPANQRRTRLQQQSHRPR